jgi:hypothetical protein
MEGAEGEEGANPEGMEGEDLEGMEGQRVRRGPMRSQSRWRSRSRSRSRRGPLIPSSGPSLTLTSMGPLLDLDWDLMGPLLAIGASVT